MRLALLFVAVALITLLLLPVQCVALVFNLRLARKIPKLWHKIVTRLIGLRINVSGNLTSGRPLLIVANHVSWSDILVLGSVAELSFIAKHEVDKIIGANLLARLQRTIFVVRENKRDVGKQAQEITRRLLDGDAIVLFAEGTTSDGHRIMDFKSSLFGAAQYAVKQGGIDHVLVQPVSISYTRLHGMPLGMYGRTVSSWAGDQELGPHLKLFLQKSAWDVEVGIGEPIRMDQAMRRRDIASLTRMQVRDMHLAANHRGSAGAALTEDDDG